MGIFDFLATDKQIGRRKKKYDPDDTSDLGLGGLKSLLGTRGAASKDARGDAMMSQTANDNLPGYFNPETREYVPWYVDLFDGGGLNQSEGLLGKDAQEIPTAVGLLETNGAPVQRAAQMAPGIGTQLSDMERLNRMPGVDPRNLGGAEGYGPMGVDPRNLGGAEGYGPMGVDPRNLGGAEGYGPMGVDPRNLGGASGYGQTGVAQQMQPAPQAVPRDSVLNDLRRDVYTAGPIESLINWLGGNQDVPLEPEPSATLGLDQPNQPFMASTSAGMGQISKPFDFDPTRSRPRSTDFGEINDSALNKQSNPLPQVDEAEFQRFLTYSKDFVNSSGENHSLEVLKRSFEEFKRMGLSF